MIWMLVVALTWLVVALPVAALIGRGLRIADRRVEAVQFQDMVPDHIPDDVLASVARQLGRSA